MLLLGIIRSIMRKCILMDKNLIIYFLIDNDIIIVIDKLYILDVF